MFKLVVIVQCAVVAEDLASKFCEFDIASRFGAARVAQYVMNRKVVDCILHLTSECDIPGRYRLHCVTYR